MNERHKKIWKLKPESRHKKWKLGRPAKSAGFQFECMCSGKFQKGKRLLQQKQYAEFLFPPSSKYKESRAAWITGPRTSVLKGNAHTYFKAFSSTLKKA